MTTQVKGTVIINGTDYEIWPFDNEYGHLEHNFEVSLERWRSTAKILVPHLRWGGECRVEVELQAQLFEEIEQVQLKGTAKFFEGFFETTDNCMDEKKINITITRSNSIPYHEKLVLIYNSPISSNAEVTIIINDFSKKTEQQRLAEEKLKLMLEELPGIGAAFKQKHERERQEEEVAKAAFNKARSMRNG